MSLAKRAAVSAVIVATAITSTAGVSDADTTHRSPAQIYGFVNRSGDGVSPRFTQSELEVLADPRHYSRLTGLDGHGYNIDTTPLPDLRARGVTTPASCFITGSVLEDARGPWFVELDDHEAAFLHSADPASAAMFQDSDGNVVLSFRQDVRLLPHFMEDPAPHAPVTQLLAKPITDYVIRRSSSATGPFDKVVAVLAARQTSSPITLYRHIVQPGPSPEGLSAWYRVSSLYDDGREIPFSWPVNYWDEGGNTANSGFYRAVVYRTSVSDITFVGECALGSDCPRADEVGVVVDFNRDGEFEPDRRCEVDDLGRLTGWYCEAIPFASRLDGPDSARYEVSLDLSPSHHWDLVSSYRVANLATGEFLAPWVTVRDDGPARNVVGSFDIANFNNSKFMGVNNRIESTVWGGLIVDRSSPEWIASVNGRIAKCIAKGYDGVIFDFMWDYIDQEWPPVGALPVGYDREEHAQSAVDFLEAVRAAYPDLHISFNGVTVDRNPANTDRKLAVADMVYHEFFYSSPHGRKTPSQVGADLGAAMSRTTSGHEVVLGVGLVVDDSDGDLASRLKRTISNVPDRMSSYALYLLISNPDLYFWIDVEVGSPYRWVTLFPEWKAPLGEPLIQHPKSAADLTGDLPTGVYVREFRNGLVLANLGCEGRCEVTVPRGLHLVGATGGWDPDLGVYAGTSVPLTDGEITYEAVESVTLAPAEGAILVRDTLGRDDPEREPNRILLPLLVTSGR